MVSTTFRFSVLFILSYFWGQFLVVSASTRIVFNEVMQSNVDYLMVDHDFPDSWVELYNNSDEDIDICGWHIGIENNLSSAYVIPGSLIIKSYGHVVVYCDKVGNGVHTDFRIDSGKGSLYLWDEKGVLVDELTLKKMPSPNIAYGREYDGSEHWQYEITPTAGSENNSGGAESLLPEPVFSQVGGVYYSPLSVTISMPEDDLPQDTKIYITLDGKEPDHSSMSGNSFTFDISENTVIRAKLISGNAIVPRSTTHSYIFHPRNTILPVISIVSDDDYFYSNENGILIGGDNDKTTNCYQEWRRPINAEYFDLREGQKTVFNQLCETMVAGNYSRAYPQKSLKLYAHKRFGTKRFNGVFWNDKPNVTKVKSFMLRNGGTACLYGKFNDALIQNIFGTHLSSLDWQANQPVLLYLNGKYKGVFNMRERSDEDYVESNYDGLEDIELHNESQNHNVYCNASTRRNTLFDIFYNNYSKADVSYSEICTMMDIDNFLNSFITEMFSTNYDYPHNNISVWRNKSEEGLWRWILKDLDYTGLRKDVSYNMFNYMFHVGNPDSEEYKDAYRVQWIIDCQQLYKKMMNFPDFRELFIDHFTAYLGDFLKPSVTLPLIEKMKNDIFEEISPTYTSYRDFSKWIGKYEGFTEYDSLNDPVDHFEKSIDEIISYWEKRPYILYEQMADFFSLGRVCKMIVMTNGCSVNMNDVTLIEGDFDGCCFENRVVRLNCIDEFGWKVLIKYDDGSEFAIQKDTSEISINLSDYSKDGNNIQVVVCETSQNINGMDFPECRKGKDVLIYGINGIRKMRVSRGINIINKRGKVNKVLYRGSLLNSDF